MPTLLCLWHFALTIQIHAHLLLLIFALVTTPCVALHHNNLYYPPPLPFCSSRIKSWQSRAKFFCPISIPFIWFFCVFKNVFFVFFFFLSFFFGVFFFVYGLLCKACYKLFWKKKYLEQNIWQSFIFYIKFYIFACNYFTSFNLVVDRSIITSTRHIFLFIFFHPWPCRIVVWKMERLNDTIIKQCKMENL